MEINSFEGLNAYFGLNTELERIRSLLLQGQDHHHAYLIQSAPYMGSITAGRMLVADLMSLHPEYKSDFVHIPFDASLILLPEAKKIAQTIALSPNFDRHIVLIEGIERMNREAANSLLKTLEEPASKTLFICTTMHSGSVLDTLKSRMIGINTPTADPALARHLLDENQAIYTELQRLHLALPDIASLCRDCDVTLFKPLMDQCLGAIDELTSTTPSPLKVYLALQFLHDKEVKDALPMPIATFFGLALEHALKMHLNSGKNPAKICRIHEALVQLNDDLKTNMNKKLMLMHFALHAT